MELKEKIIKEIKKIYDPEIPVNVYELGLIYDIKIEKNNNVKIKMIFDSTFDLSKELYIIVLQ